MDGVTSGSGHAAQHMINKTLGLLFMFLTAPIWISAIVFSDSHPSHKSGIWLTTVSFLIPSFIIYRNITAAMTKGTPFKDALFGQFSWFSHRRRPGNNPFVQK